MNNGNTEQRVGMMIPKLRTMVKLATNPRQLVVYLASNGLLDWVPNKPYLKLFYWGMIGKRLHLKDPKGFNEKLQWLKLYYRDETYVKLVDKYEVKLFVKQNYPEINLIKTLGVWDKAEEIDFDILPDQFVIKCTHDSGSTVICQNKKELDINKVRNILKVSLKKSMYKYGREWVYRNVEPRIIAEEYMHDDDADELKDYKFLCFHGEVKCCFVGSDRFSKEGLHTSYFDKNWNPLPFTRHYPRREDIPKPEKLSQMIELAERMSNRMPFVRIDFYIVHHEIYFGEYTFFPGCGFLEFDPDEWDTKLGEWIRLPDYSGS